MLNGELEKWFENADVGLCAEHGCYYRHPKTISEQIKKGKSEDSWFPLVGQFDISWRDTIRPLFEHYTERTPGSYIEEKEVNFI